MRYRSFLGIAFALLVSADATQAQEQSADEPVSVSWKDSIFWNGDLRLRYEAIDEEGEEDRSRFRFRGRFGLTSQLMSNLQFIARLATSDGDPVSTNLTFGDGFSSKNIAIDRVFLNWNAYGDLDIAFGKIGVPWIRAGGNSLLWDSDLNPEGILADWQSGNFFANVGTFVVAERSSADDSWLHALQGGLSLNWAETSRLRLMAAYFDYTNTIGNPPFYQGEAKGNSVDVNGNLIHDYDILEVSGDFQTVINGLPVSFFGVWAQNTAIDVGDAAYALGFWVGNVNARGTMQFSYAWHDTEPDAVMGIFTDSDFGAGATDSRGHFIKAKYGLRANIELGATLIISEIEMFRGNRHDYDRLQLDIEFLFD